MTTTAAVTPTMTIAEEPPRRFSDYLELTKPRLSLLSVLTALIGYLAARPPHDPLKMVWVIIGTSLAAGGVATLNQWLEVDTDARMHRTAGRPLPSGKIATGSAFVLGSIMCIAALMLTFAQVNPLAALFVLFTIATYLGWYTPAKRWSRWSTEIGALAGAFPPLIGWAAGEGRVSALGWILFAVLFFWQMPHFMAVAWIYRRDYSAVHFPMPTVTDQTGRRAALWSFACTLILILVSLLPVFLGFDTLWYGGARRGLRPLVSLAGGRIPAGEGPGRFGPKALPRLDRLSAADPGRARRRPDDFPLTGTPVPYERAHEHPVGPAAPRDHALPAPVVAAIVAVSAMAASLFLCWLACHHVPTDAAGTRALLFLLAPRVAHAQRPLGSRPHGRLPVYSRPGAIAAHRASMFTAFVFSTVFLVTYIANHALHGDMRFHGQWARFGLLISPCSFPTSASR